MNTDEGRLIEEWDKEGKHFVVRTARWSDLEGYAAMHRTLYKEGVMASPRDADARVGSELLSKWLIHMVCGTGVLFVVEADGRIVGEGTLQPATGDGAITLGLLILKPYRGLGIGRRLMLALEGEARRLGKRRIVLTVWAANPAAMHLYSDVGYREIGRFPEWIRSDLVPGGVSDLVWMIKDLK